MEASIIMGLKNTRTGNGTVLTESMRAEALEMGHRKAARAVETGCVQEKHYLLSQSWCFPSPQKAEAAVHRKQASGAQSKAEVGRERMVDEGGEEKCKGKSIF